MNEIVKKVMSCEGLRELLGVAHVKKKIRFSSTDKWKESTMKLLAAVVLKLRK